VEIPEHLNNFFIDVKSMVDMEIIATNISIQRSTWYLLTKTPHDTNFFRQTQRKNTNFSIFNVVACAGN